MTSPATLDRAGIAARIPHRGAMCLLDRLERWDAERIVCTATNHRDAHHPLRTASGLLAPCAIEYAAQAMALHGALLAHDAGAAVSPGYLASARDVRLHVLRLDEVPGALHVEATRQLGDERQLLYGFVVSHAGRTLAEGRATVVLNTAPIDASREQP
jgi:predicted hotdog family 3-hydroxylacyl-ACP dehydratase